MNCVLDANALIALINGEDGASEVADLMTEENNDLFVHSVNLCEVYYDYLRRNGESTAKRVVEGILALGLILRDDMDTAFWQQAGGYKAELRRVSLADCFCMALANRLQADIVTADHHEFDEVAQRKICTVRFIR